MKHYVITGFLFFLALSLQAQHYKTPEWVKSIPNYGEYTAIGISDPRLDNDSLAQKQALIRAKAMIAMMHEVEIAYTSEHYQSETEQHRTYQLDEIIEKLAMYKSRLPYNEKDFRIIEQHTNQNKECIILLTYTDSNYAKDHVLKANAEYYSKIYETSITRNYQAAELSNLHIIDSTQEGMLHYRYRYEADGRDMKITSRSGGISHDFPNYHYKYFNTDTVNNFIHYDAIKDCDKGLWLAYFSGWLYGTAEGSKNLTSRVKNLEDQFNEGRENATHYESADKQEEMARQIARNTMSFYLHGFSLYQNQMFLKLSSPQLNEKCPKEWIDLTTQPQDEPLKEKRSFWDWLFGRNK